MPPAPDRVLRLLRVLGAVVTAVAICTAWLVPTASAATTTTTAAPLAVTATTTSPATSAAATAPTATVQSTTTATSGTSPKVTLTPAGSGSGTTVTAKVDVEGCPAGPITITDTIDNGSQTIAKNGAPATVISHGTPGSYAVTATCANGAKATAVFVVTKVKGPSVKLTPASTGPTPTTINVSVQGCPPGPIQITDTINNGSQTIKKDGAPATIPSTGDPGTYKVTAKCSADGATATGSFVVKPGAPPTVTLDPASSGPVLKTVNVIVNGCPPGKITITDTINKGSQTIKKNKAPATILSQGDPGTYTVTAKCADAVSGHAQFVVTPAGPIQTGDGTMYRGASGPGWPTGLGLAMLVLGSLGVFGLGYRRWRRRDSLR